MQQADENQPEESPAPNEDDLTEQDQETYNNMINTLSKMNAKIEKAKTRLGVDTLPDKHARTG